MTTTEAPRITCRRCHAILSPSNTKGIGPTCARKEREQAREDARIAAIETAAAHVDFSAFKTAATVRDKAIQLLIDRSLTPTRIPGLYIATSSDGESTYVVDMIENTCTCKAGIRLGRCNHLAASHIAELVDARPASLALAA